MLLARLKAHNPRLGYVKHGFGMPKCKRPDDPNKDVLAASLLFTAGQQVEVTPEDAAILREVREIEGNPNSHLAFDIWDPAIESAPPEMIVAQDEKGQGITSKAMQAAFVPRTEIDDMIARAVAQALAARDAQAKPVEAAAPVTAPAAAEEKKSPAADKVSRYFPAAEKGQKK